MSTVCSKIAPSPSWLKCRLKKRGRLTCVFIPCYEIPFPFTHSICTERIKTKHLKQYPLAPPPLTVCKIINFRDLRGWDQFGCRREGWENEKCGVKKRKTWLKCERVKIKHSSTWDLLWIVWFLKSCVCGIPFLIGFNIRFWVKIILLASYDKLWQVMSSFHVCLVFFSIKRFKSIILLFRSLFIFFQIIKERKSKVVVPKNS